MKEEDNEKHCLAMLENMLADMEQAAAWYQPTDFWRVGIAGIMADIRAHGLAGFRSYHSCTGFFVPLYTRPYYLQHRNLVDPLVAWLDTLPFRKAGTDIVNFLSGRANAFADYRVFRAADDDSPPCLADIGESKAGKPLEQFVFDGRRYSLSLLNYLRALVFLKRRARPARLARVLEIGGGFGTLGEIMLKAENQALYVDVDLPPVAALATYYLREIFGEEAVLGYDRTRDWEQINLDDLPASCRAVVLCPWQLPKLQGQVDLFANFISFQEMEPEVVRNYIRLVQSHRPAHVMLRNLREGKKKKESPDQLGVNEPILLDDMVAWFDDYREIARDTPVFGELKIDNFHSELVLLARAEAGD